MNTFKTRQAAWTALILIDHVRSFGVHKIVSVCPDTGGITFRKLGAAFSIGPDFRVEQLLTAVKFHKPEPYTLTGNSDTFASKGDVWNADNAQHNTYRDRARARTNAFGDLCSKPDVEGYDADGYATSMANHEAQRLALARVRAHENVRRVKDDRARNMVNVRRAYRSAVQS